MSPEREYVIARLERKGHRFEVLVNPNIAMNLREGKKVNIHELLVGDIVYKDVRRGLKASEELLRKIFGTTNVHEVAEIIVREGEIQLTTEQRRKMIEAKRRQIILYISKSCVDPKTGLPHPPARIERAIEEARVGIDPFKDIEVQALDVIRAISKIIPIKIAKAYVAVRIPPPYSGKAYKYLSSLGEVKRMNWLSDGSLDMELEIPAGMKQELIEKVNSLTKGQGTIKILYEK